MKKKEWLFMQTPKEKAYQLASNNLVIEYYHLVEEEIDKL